MDIEGATGFIESSLRFNCQACLHYISEMALAWRCRTPLAPSQSSHSTFSAAPSSSLSLRSRHSQATAWAPARHPPSRVCDAATRRHGHPVPCVSRADPQPAGAALQRLRHALNPGAAVTGVPHDAHPFCTLRVAFPSRVCPWGAA